MSQPVKKFTSAATLAFTVEHDNPEFISDDEILRAILECISNVTNAGEWQEVCGNDFYDTQEQV